MATKRDRLKKEIRLAIQDAWNNPSDKGETFGIFLDDASAAVIKILRDKGVIK